MFHPLDTGRVAFSNERKGRPPEHDNNQSHKSSNTSKQLTKKHKTTARARHMRTTSKQQTAINLLVKLMRLGDAETLAEHVHSVYGADQAVAARLARQLLANNETQCREALLLAAQKGVTGLAELLLLHMHTVGWQLTGGVEHSCLFEPHVTALHLACAANNHRLVQLLLAHRHRISVPHKASCNCDVCVESRETGESLQSCHERMDSYKALTSRAYIWLGAHDPVLFMIRIVKHLNKCAADEPCFRDTYEDMVRQVKANAGELAGLCWREDEVLTLLANDEGMAVGRTALNNYPRLDLALRTELTEFVTSTQVQEVMMKQWMGSWATYSTTSLDRVGHLFTKATHYFPFFALTSLIYILTFGQYPKSNRNPYGRFLLYAASYLLFMFNLASSMTTKTANHRGLPTDPLELLNIVYAWLYILGMLFWDLTTFLQMGTNQFLSVWWHTMDFVNACLFLYAGNFLVRSSIDVATDGLQDLYRVRWQGWDPQLMFESLYYTSCIIALWRVFYLLQMTRLLGPTIISIKACIKKTSFYLIVMVITIVSFSFGVSAMYGQYFGPENYIEENAGSYQEVIKTDPSLQGWVMTMYTLYEAFYGYLPPQMQLLIVGSMGPPHGLLQSQHTFSQWFTMIVTGVYHSVVIICLLNLMISLLVNFATEIMDRSDAEWKFVRTQVWLEYFDSCHAVPPPFNIVWLVAKAVHMCLRRDVVFQCPDLCYVKKTQNDEYRLKYAQLIRVLYARYLSTKEKEKKHDDEKK